MPLYIVRFITTAYAIERPYPAANARECLDTAEADFRTWNADAELHEVLVLPPQGQRYLDPADANGSATAEYLCRLTPEGWRKVCADARPFETS